MEEGRKVQSLGDLLQVLLLVLGGFQLLVMIFASATTGLTILLAFGIIMFAIYAFIALALKAVLAAFGVLVCTTSNIESILRSTHSTLVQTSKKLFPNPEPEVTTQTKSKTVPNAIDIATTDGPVKPKAVDGDPDKFQCPCCGKIQPANRSKCWSCSVDFLNTADL